MVQEKSNKRLSEQGFTLIETMVSLFIILTVVSAGFFAIRVGLQSTFAARDQVTAFFLAQEAVEIVKNIRDSNSVTETVWNEGIIGDCETRDCAADATSGALSVCSGDCVLLRDTNGLFGHQSGARTRFSRSVRIQQVPNNASELRIDVVVRYGTRTLEISEQIFDWRI